MGGAKRDTLRMDETMKVLVKQAQKGDPEAFIQLIEKNRQALVRVAKGFFGSEEDVADAIQDTILNAYEHIKELKKAEYFKTWLIRILINNCVRIYNQNRKVQPVERMPENGESIPPESDVEFLELLSSLPEDSRLIFQLYYGEQFTTKEISEILGMKENTVKSRLRRGRERLRKEIV